MSKKEQPNYYAIIPATVRYDTNLKYTVKMVIVMLKINTLQIYIM